MQSLGSTKLGLPFMMLDNELIFKSHYKMPALKRIRKLCCSQWINYTNKARYFCSGWYQGGISVMDFTDSSNPKEIGYFDRGPIETKILLLVVFGLYIFIKEKFMQQKL